MKINLKNIHSPCEQCFIHGYSYSPDNDGCQRCEYNIAIAILKEVLRENDYCTLCKNVEHIKKIIIWGTTSFIKKKNQSS